MLKVFANVTLKKNFTFTLIPNIYYSHTANIHVSRSVFMVIFLISQANNYLHYYSLWR